MSAAAAQPAANAATLPDIDSAAGAEHQCGAESHEVSGHMRGKQAVEREVARRIDITAVDAEQNGQGGFHGQLAKLWWVIFVLYIEDHEQVPPEGAGYGRSDTRTCCRHCELYSTRALWSEIRPDVENRDPGLSTHAAAGGRQNPAAAIGNRRLQRHGKCDPERWPHSL